MIDLAGFTAIVRPVFLLSQNEAICGTFFAGIIKYISRKRKAIVGKIGSK